MISCVPTPAPACSRVQEPDTNYRSAPTIRQRVLYLLSGYTRTVNPHMLAHIFGISRALACRYLIDMMRRGDLARTPVLARRWRYEYYKPSPPHQDLGQHHQLLAKRLGGSP